MAVAVAMTLAVSAGALSAAVGCTLNDPDRDIMRIFPEATNYTTDFISIDQRGGANLYASIEERLGDQLDDVYESPDVAYAYYTVLKGESVIGRVHGVNQRGRFGGIQLILATSPEGEIVDFYYQRLPSPEAERFMDAGFTNQFRGLTLLDFHRRRLGVAGSEIELISDPSEDSEADFRATLRGLRKNLILLDEFMLGNAYRKQIAELQLSPDAPTDPAPENGSLPQGQGDREREVDRND